MDEIRNSKKVIEALIQVVWLEGELKRLSEFWTEHCVNHAAPEGQQQGLKALHEYHVAFQAALSAFSDPEIEIQQQISEGDRVVTQLLTMAKHTGRFMEKEPSGKVVTLATIRIDRLEGGKVAEHWSIADMAGLLQQLTS